MSVDRVKWDMEYDVVVLGSGGAALTAAISAHDFGAKEVVVLEKSDELGGTWWDNDYPEAGVDTPNHFSPFGQVVLMLWQRACDFPHWWALDFPHAPH